MVYGLLKERVLKTEETMNRKNFEKIEQNNFFLTYLYLQIGKNLIMPSGRGYLVIQENFFN